MWMNCFNFVCLLCMVWNDNNNNNKKFIALLLLTIFLIFFCQSFIFIFYLDEIKLYNCTMVMVSHDILSIQTTNYPLFDFFFQGKVWIICIFFLFYLFFSIYSFDINLFVSINNMTLIRFSSYWFKSRIFRRPFNYVTFSFCSGL